MRVLGGTLQPVELTAETEEASQVARISCMSLIPRGLWIFPGGTVAYTLIWGYDGPSPPLISAKSVQASVVDKRPAIYARASWALALL